MAKSNCTQTASNDQVSRFSVDHDMVGALLNLNSVHQMFFCISQNEISARELNAYALLGISNILNEVHDEIEHSYNEMIDQEDKFIERHNKLRAALAAYGESGGLVDKSAIAKILADDEKDMPNAI